MELTVKNFLVNIDTVQVVFYLEAALEDIYFQKKLNVVPKLNIVKV